MSKKWIQGAIKHPGAPTRKAKAAGMSVGAFIAHPPKGRDDRNQATGQSGEDAGASPSRQVARARAVERMPGWVPARAFVLLPKLRGQCCVASLILFHNAPPLTAKCIRSHDRCFAGTFATSMLDSVGQRLVGPHRAPLLLPATFLPRQGTRREPWQSRRLAGRRVWR